MKEKFRAYEPEQAYLFPPSPKDWLPTGHLAHFISDVVDELDLREFGAGYASDERGEKAYHPSMMLKVLMYGYSTGVFSSRKIAKRIEEDVAFRYLAAGHFPSHRTFRRFRSRHIAQFERIFVRVVQVAKEAKFVKLGVLAIDGTKIKANANKHKAMSYDRMLKEEEKINKEIEELLHEAEAVDMREDEEFGEENRGDEIPAELKDRRRRLAVIRAAKERIEERQREEDLAKGRKEGDDKKASEKRPQGGISKFKREFGEPNPKAQDNFTDPDSRIMKTSTGGFEQCYNGQAAVDQEAHIIVAVGMTESASDVKQLIPMVKAVKENTGSLPRVILGDSGFRSEENLQVMEELGVESFIAIGREGKRVKIGQDLKATIRCKERLATERGDKLYRKRKGLIEPVFGMIKQGLGFRMFLLRGYKKVLGEWNLVCCALNLKRMNALMT